MDPALDTRPSLLVRLRDSTDREAWRLFVDLYGPLVYALGRRHGLQDADAADLTQEVFSSVAAAVRSLHYDPRRGSFRGWLYRVAHNRLLDWHRRCRPGRGSGDSAMRDLLDRVPAPENPLDDWDRDYERGVFAWAAERVRVDFRENTWRAFWLTAVEGLSADEAARALNMSLGAVHVARSRVMARLKESVRPLLEQ
jgi:RNA polymerase sigma-70 factor (ECF subfamily)